MAHLLEAGPSAPLSENPDARATPEITFGVELEFLVIYDPERFSERFPLAIGSSEDPASAYSLTKGMRAVHQALTMQAPELPLYGLYESLKMEENCNIRYEKWHVVTDGSIHLDSHEEGIARGGFEVDAVELISRVLSAESDDWEQELSTIISALHNAYPPDEYKVLVNDSTGLHVHVGEKNTGIDLKIAQRISKVTAGFERCFDMLHATNRIHYNAQASFCTGTSSFLKLWLEDRIEAGAMIDPRVSSDSLFEEPLFATDLALYMDLIERQKNFSDLADMISGFTGKTCAINLHPLVHGKTLEFRQHRGSLDFEEIRAWVKVVTRVAEVACRLTDEDMDAFISPRLIDSSFHPLSLLEALSLDHTTQNFYAAKLSSRSRSFQKQWIRRKLSKTCEALHRLVICVEAHRYFDNSPAEVANQISKKYKTKVYGLSFDQEDGECPFWSDFADHLASDEVEKS